MSGARGCGRVAELEGLPRPLPVLTAAVVVPTAGAAAGRVGLATDQATEKATQKAIAARGPVEPVKRRVMPR